MITIAWVCLLLVAGIAATDQSLPARTGGEDCRTYVTADIYILADASNSIFPVGWNRQLAFVVKIVRAFTLGVKDVQIAFGSFSTRFLHRIDLNTYTDQDQFAADVLATQQLQELTFTYDALNAINREGYLTNQSLGARNGVPKILIVITDGQSDNITRTVQAADDLKSQGVTIISVGVGVTYLEELQGIASGPQYVFSVHNFAALDLIRDQITATICVVTPEPTTVTPEPTTREDCRSYVVADIYYLTDSSNSIFPVGWRRELEFVTNTLRTFNLGVNYVQAAFGIFSTRFLHRIDLNTYTDQDQFAADVLATPQLQELTFTYDALNAINREGYLTNQALGARNGVPKVLVLITDGQSENITRTLQAADDLKSQGIRLVSVGVGVTNLEELQGIATNPAHVFSVKDFAALESIRDEITFIFCDEPTTTTTEPTTTTPEPTTTTPRPTKPTRRPTTTTRRPTTTTRRPTTTTRRPTTTTRRPTTTTRRPTTTTRRPTTTTRRPTTTTRRPTTTTTEPTTTTPEPTTTTPEPTTTTEEPTTTTPEPTTTTTTTTTAVPTTTRGEDCRNHVVADIYYLTDSSFSISPTGWNRQLEFVTKTARAFYLGVNDVQLALGIFSTQFQQRINLDKYTDQDQFSQDVLRTRQLNGLTYTSDALNAINREGYLTSSLYGARSGVPKVLIVLTDGQSNNIARTLKAAADLRRQKITILAVGVGLTNFIELQGIAGNPKNVFSVRNFDALDSITDLITQRICDVPIDQVPPCSLPGELDLAVLVDASSNLGQDIFDRNFEFVASFVRDFTLSEASTKVALLTYSTSPQTVFSWTSSIDQIYETLLSVPFIDGVSNTHLVLRAALNLFSPANGGRAGARKAVIVITDRESTDHDATFQVSNELKSQGINIFTLGIQPTADSLELTGLSSRVPYNFPVPNYDTLFSYSSRVAQVVCSAPQPPEPVVPCPPAKELDLFFVLDSSGSIGLEYYQFNFELIARVLSAYTIGEDATKVALLTYGTSVRLRFNLSSNKTYIDEQLKNVPYQGSTTNTHLGLNYILTSGINDPSNGARPSAEKKIVLITDGLSTVPDQTLIAAQAVRDNGFTVAAVGVGGQVDENELNGIASEPGFVLKPDNYEVLENFASSISDIACNNRVKS